MGRQREDFLDQKPHEDRPRMYCVQAEGCAPIVRAFREGSCFALGWDNPSTAAAGLRVPGAVGDFLILDAVRESGGGAVAVPEGETFEMQAHMGWLMAGQLLEAHPHPDEDTIRHYLSGNLCRCAAYAEIVKAVKLAADKVTIV